MLIPLAVPVFALFTGKPSDGAFVFCFSVFWCGRDRDLSVYLPERAADDRLYDKMQRAIDYMAQI